MNPFIYHRILVFHSSVDSLRVLDENVQSNTAFFNTIQYLFLRREMIAPTLLKAILKKRILLRGEAKA